jgi:hypothetical protein
LRRWQAAGPNKGGLGEASHAFIERAMQAGITFAKARGGGGN